MAKDTDPFELWWASDVHGWGKQRCCAEYTLAAEAWDAGVAWRPSQENRLIDEVERLRWELGVAKETAKWAWDRLPPGAQGPMSADMIHMAAELEDDE